MRAYRRLFIIEAVTFTLALPTFYLVRRIEPESVSWLKVELAALFLYAMITLPYLTLELLYRRKCKTAAEANEELEAEVNPKAKARRK